MTRTRRLARGRPRTSPLDRREQLRAAKRAQRQRERRAGLAAVQLRLPADQAERLRAAANAPSFRSALDQFLEEAVLDLDKWPVLRTLAWNRADRWIPAEDALALYERNWRFVELERLATEEANLVDRLKNRFGAGVLNA
jgi:hypothetical protein